jgi:outer membrane autotransporter protein
MIFIKKIGRLSALVLLGLFPLSYSPLVYGFTATTPAAQGAASALTQLDAAGLAPTVGLQKVIATLKLQTTQARLDDALLQLIPEANGGTVIGSLMLQNLSFDTVIARLNEINMARYDQSMGYMAEEGLKCGGQHGPMVLGNYLLQQTSEGLPGYKTTGAGVGLFADVPINAFSKVGGTITYAGAAIKNADTVANASNANGFQGTVYASTGYRWFFVDAVGSMGRNNYRTKRNVLMTSQRAEGKFSGMQFGAKGRVGLNINVGGLIASPLVSLRYMRLNTDKYDETGAPGANLTVLGKKITGITMGTGIKLMESTDTDHFAPELHVILLRDVKSLSFSSTARLTDGGPVFITNGATFPKFGVNVGASITAKLRENALITGSYDFEGRSKFASHSLLLKFRLLF